MGGKITGNIVFLTLGGDISVRQLLTLYRRLLINYESVLACSPLGVVGGIAYGLVVLASELAIQELCLIRDVAGSGVEFKSLPCWMLFALPTAGATIPGCSHALLKPGDRETGIVFILSRMHSRYSVLPLRNALLDFAGGAFSLAAGQSAGRESPEVRLGGAINSMLGQRLRQAMDTMRRDTTEAVCVCERSPKTSKEILYGAMTLERIETSALSSVL